MIYQTTITLSTHQYALITDITPNNKAAPTFHGEWKVLGALDS
jgi:hypothetical protein